MKHLENKAHFRLWREVFSFSTQHETVRPLRYPADYPKVLSMVFMLFVNGIESLSSFYLPSMGETVKRYTITTLNPEFEQVHGRVSQALKQFK